MPQARPKLSFPPLVKSQQWTVKSEASWPGAEYTRRSRMRTVCVETYNPAFVDELQSSMGKESWPRFEQAMRPSTNSRLIRGKPPPEAGPKPIRKAYELPRAEAEGVDMGASLAGTTMSLSGHTSRSRLHETNYTVYGPVPAHLFEDREKVNAPRPRGCERRVAAWQNVPPGSAAARCGRRAAAV